MNKANQIAKKLNEFLKNTEEIQSFFQSKRLIQSHKEIYECELELKKMQKEILKMKTDPNNDAAYLIKAYEEKYQNFMNHPLVVNYLDDKENAELLIQWVKDYIEGQLGAK